MRALDLAILSLHSDRTVGELKEMLDNFEICKDNDGQLVVYTGLRAGPDGQLVPVEEKGVNGD